MYKANKVHGCSIIECYNDGHDSIKSTRDMTVMTRLNQHDLDLTGARLVRWGPAPLARGEVGGWGGAGQASEQAHRHPVLGHYVEGTG